MDWLSQVTDIVDKYTATPASAVPASVNTDFDRVSQVAPAEHISAGLAEAFRSEQTAPFATMLSQLFGRSPTTQKSNVLNTLAATLGPTLMSQLLAKHGGSGAASELQNGNATISPSAADQVPASSVEAAAAEAEKKDPSIIDRISKFYADQPALIKTLGGVALTVALAKVAQRQKQGGR